MALLAGPLTHAVCAVVAAIWWHFSGTSHHTCDLVHHSACSQSCRLQDWPNPGRLVPTGTVITVVPLVFAGVANARVFRNPRRLSGLSHLDLRTAIVAKELGFESLNLGQDVSQRHELSKAAPSTNVPVTRVRGVGSQCTMVYRNYTRCNTGATAQGGVRCT